MAEINTDSGGGGGKHGKKGRKKGGNPRIDMTPMVDLAFLLLTFFVLTSNLNKAKTMEITMPKDVEDTTVTTKVNFKLAHTLLLDGNKDGIIYYYDGMLNESTELHETTLDPVKGLRKYATDVNSGVVEKMKTIREDFKKGKMADTTFRRLRSQVRGDKNAPFFIIKWGGDATYADVINVIDELKICDVDKYALTTITRLELEGLSKKTGRQYPELAQPTPAEAP
ncbi:MAG: hypothetical protein Fur0041_18770 [Bacteroidia bacterium]